MAKKDLENITLVILILVLLINQTLYTIFDFQIFNKLAKIIFIKGKYIEFVVLVAICILAYIKRKNKDKDPEDLTTSCEFPIHLLEDKIPVNSNLSMTIKMKPNSRVVYWTKDALEEFPASFSGSELSVLTNTGTVQSDKDGNAGIWFRDSKIQGDSRYVYARFEVTPGVLGAVQKIVFEEKKKD